jgi:hypothetical protein
VRQIQAILRDIVRILPLTHYYRLKVRLRQRAEFGAAETGRVLSASHTATAMPLHPGDDSSIGSSCALISRGSYSSVPIGSSVDIALHVLLLMGGHLIDLLLRHSAGSEMLSV